MKSKKSKTFSGNMYLLGVGSTGLGAGEFFGAGLLTIQKIKGTKKVGEQVNKKDLTGERTDVVFLNQLGVDNLITRLYEIKSLMYKGREDAANTESLGNTYERREVPRPRTKPRVYATSKTKRGGPSGKSVEAPRPARSKKR